MGTLTNQEDGQGMLGPLFAVNPVATPQILQAEHSWLRARCQRLTRGKNSEFQAEDFVQEAFLVLFQRHGHLCFQSRSDLRRWLWRVALNRWISQQRRRTPSTPGVDLDEVPENGRRAGDGCLLAEGDLLWTLRQRLPARQDLAIMLRDYLGLRFDVIANILGCRSVSSARDLRLRGLKTLRIAPGGSRQEG